MPTILISAPSLDPKRNVSGVSSVVRTILQVLSDEHDFIHLELGSEQARHGLARVSNSTRKILSAIRLCCTAQYDVFHSNTAANNSSLLRDSLFMLVSRLRGKPCIWHLHGGNYMTAPATGAMALLMRLLARIATRVVVLSETEREFFVNAYKIRPGTVQTVFNGIIQPFRPQSFRVTKTDGRLSVIYAGRLADEKGMKVLVSCLTGLIGSASIEVNIFGDGKWRPQIIELAEASLNINYGGVLSPDGVREAMQSHSVLILPSLRGEGMPMVLIEAMSMGLVPICTPLASIPEIVQDGKTGLLIQPDAQRLRAALEKLAANATATEEMSRNAQAYASVNFDARKNFAAFGRMYTELQTR